jgi:Flp pilus assembly protein TadD
MTELPARDGIGDAIEALREALSRSPSDGSFRYALAALLAMTGNEEESLFHLEQAENRGIDGRPLRDWLKAR